MVALIAVAATFAFGLLLLPALIPGMRVRGMLDVLKVGLLGGVLSAVLSKVILVILTLIFLLPIKISGPIAGFIVQGLVNTALLGIIGKVSDSIEFDRVRSTLWAAFALTALQTVVRLIA